MAVFLDTIKMEDVKKFHALGIIRGVTSNPVILLKENICGDMDEVKDEILRVAKFIHPYPLSVEVTNNDSADMIAQAKVFAGWADNINVKIPVHGPNGELDNLRVITELESKHNIRVNCTATMSAQQAFLAAETGATYVSIFGGRINDMGYDSCVEIKRLRVLLDQHSLKSKIIVGSTREAFNIAQWLEAGAHIVTAPPEILEKVLIHPMTIKTVREFVDAGKKIEEDSKIKRIA